MTTAGGSAGGSGFETGDSTVAARLSIDIPTEGVQSLREITQEISRFRTEMEAASRSEGDFIGFFQTLPSIASQAANAYKTFADQLERSLAMQQRMSGAVGQWDVQPGSTPDNFKGMSSGMGRADKDITQTVADMDRMREMGAAGERQYMNLRQQRGALRPGDVPTSNSDNDIAASNERISTRERVNQERSAGPGGGAGGGGLAGKMGQYSGVASSIMNEFAAGSSGGVGAMLSRGIASAAGHYAQGGFGGGSGGPPPHTSGAIPTPPSGASGAVGSDAGGGGLLSMLSKGMGGMAGGALGLAGLGLTGFEAAQFMGPRLQNLREMGLTEGGGIKEGAAQELQARMIALNPFISTDQARSMVQAALRDGYSGKEYDSVFSLMKSNLVDFGLSVQQSREMIKKDMVEGGATPGSINAELEREKKQSVLSKDNRMSWNDRQAANQNLRGVMEDAGTSSGMASNSANQIVNMYDDDEATKGLAADAASNVIGGNEGTNYSAQALALQVAGIPPSSDYGDWADQLSQAGPQAWEKIYRWIAQQSGGKRGPFRTLLSRVLGQNVTQKQADILLQKVKGGGRNETSRVQQMDGAGDSIEQRSSMESAIGSGSRTSALGGTLADLVTGNWSNIPQRWRAADYDEQSDHIPILDKLVESQGGDPNKILVQDGSGGWNKLQPGNRDQLDALSKGGKWKRDGDGDSQGYTLAQSSSSMDPSFGRQKVEVGGSVQITVSAEQGTKVTSSPNVIRLTQNQVNANAAYGNYTMNSAAPGDR